jgi:hypothetical protein
MDSLMCQQGVELFPGLESKRVADADEVIHGRARQAGPEMEINLVERTQLVSHAEVQQVPGPSTLGKIARVFDECIGRPCELPVEKECRFSCEVSGAGLRRPI